MAIPGFQEIMLPLLEKMNDGEVHNIRDLVDELGEYFRLSDSERNELLDSGRQARFDNRVHWARTYLVKSDLLESVGRGLIRITNRGYSVLNDAPDEININYLKQFEEFQDFRERSHSEDTRESASTDDEDEETPEEQMASTFRQLRKALIEDILDAVLSISPSKFERLVIDLLLAMGYGSSLDSGEHIGKSGDDGVDGVIREDKLGLDEIYLQAKRYAKANPIDVKQVREFVGSLTSKGSTKGVFITTSYFTKPALDFAERIHTHRIILIDGQQLATLMIEHDVGVSVQERYVIKQIDKNFFEVE